jgi:hypothetical protein
MRKFQWIAGLSAIGLFMASCSGNTAKTQAPAPSQQTVASQPKPAPSPKETVKLLPVPPNLLPTVNVPQRMSQTVTKQSDPFSQLPVTSTQQAALPAQPAKATKPVSQKAPAQKPAPQSLGKKSPQVESTQTSQSATKTPQNAASPKAATKPAPVPTDLANAVVVSGIVQVQGRVSAIVIAPNEPTSRTVGVGDYLSGGQVRVKQIVLQSEPVVILEQNGVEVIKSVSSSFS